MTLNISITLMDQLHVLAQEAGKVVMAVYESDFEVETKSDKSPVTEADKKADELITTTIRETITKDFPIISEESFDPKKPRDGSKPFWLVDPLDGTRDFIDRNGEFTVNIALIEHGRPVIGVVHAPALGLTYLGSKHGSFEQVGDDAPRKIECRKPPHSGMIALVSRHHNSPKVEDYLADYHVQDTVGVGSSLKFCRIAAGIADIYPRLGPTSEWDTAAADAVVTFAGGSVTQMDGTPLAYGKQEIRNPHFVVRGKQD